MTSHVVSSPRRAGKSTRYRRTLVRALADIAAALDDEARSRSITIEGAHDRLVVDEIRRAAGSIRFAATLALQARMSTRIVEFYVAGGMDYVALVRRADVRGVIA